jgi:hypothetical protein
MPTGSKREGNMNRGQYKEGSVREAVRRLHVSEIPCSIATFTRTLRRVQESRNLEKGNLFSFFDKFGTLCPCLAETMQIASRKFWRFDLQNGPGYKHSAHTRPLTDRTWIHASVCAFSSSLIVVSTGAQFWFLPLTSSSVGSVKSNHYQVTVLLFFYYLL